MAADGMAADGMEAVMLGAQHDDHRTHEDEGVWPELASAYQQVTRILSSRLDDGKPLTAFACYHAVVSAFPTTDPAWPHLAGLVAEVLASWTDAGRVKVVDHQTWAVVKA